MYSDSCGTFFSCSSVLAVAVFEFRATNLFQATSFAEAEVTHATGFIVNDCISIVRLNNSLVL